MTGGEIFLADGNHSFRERLAGELLSRGYKVSTTSVLSPALGLAESASVGAAVDVGTHGGIGLGLVSNLRRLRPDLRIIALTAYGGTASALEAMRRGAQFYLYRPVDADDVLTALTDGRVQGPRFARPAGSPSLALIEWEHIQRVLVDCAGNVSEAARRLKISRRTLQLRLRRPPPEE